MFACILQTPISKSSTQADSLLGTFNYGMDTTATSTVISQSTVTAATAMVKKFFFNFLFINMKKDLSGDINERTCLFKEILILTLIVSDHLNISEVSFSYFA